MNETKITSKYIHNINIKNLLIIFLLTEVPLSSSSNNLKFTA